MSIDYKTTKLWEETLGQTKGKYKDEIERLRNSYDSVRENASQLAGTIKVKFLEYTDHTVDHADALWKMADIILKDSKLKLNPAEAYVLGCSFLLHDLGMSCAVYNNEKELRETHQWKDFASSLKRKGVKDEDIVKRADLETLRLLHPVNAKQLPNHLFDKNGKQEYIINESEFRDGFGEIIGELSYSHGLPVKELERLFPGPISGSIPSLPSEWEIDSIKLACILRIADAIHISSDRTPSILMASTEFGDVSKLHWGFQSKMKTPRCDKGQLVFSSLSFGKQNREEWWTCFDTLKMIDRELRAVNALLGRRELPPLAVSNVKNIEDPKYLADIVKVEGWTPVEANMKVSNVSGLVKSLGGSALYGDDESVPLRELVQNASDAIRARRLIEKRDENWGDVHVRMIDIDEETAMIEVEDNGVGMSEDVLVGHFLDFGSSFWHSNSMLSEFPDLESSGFESTGHFGIGFFSVFMWGDKVTVISRKYNEGQDKTNVLEFDSGAESRPLLRPAEKDEQLKDGGTLVKVLLKKDVFKRFDDGHQTIEKKMCCLFPSIDCNIFLEGKKSPPQKIISANDWIYMEAKKFVDRIGSGYYFKRYGKNRDNYLKTLGPRVRLIKDNKGFVWGRGTLDPDETGFLTTGGIKAGRTMVFSGCIKATCSTANRFEATPIVPLDAFASWAEEQKDLLLADLSWQKYDPDFKIAALLCSLKIPVEKFAIAYYKDILVNYEQIKQKIKQTKLDEYVIFDTISMPIEEGKCVYEKNVFFTNNFFPSICTPTAHLRRRYSDISRPIYPNVENPPLLYELIVKAIAEVWGEDVEKIEKRVPNGKRVLKKVGTIDGKPDIEGCISIIKKPKNKGALKDKGASAKTSAKKSAPKATKSPASKALPKAKKSTTPKPAKKKAKGIKKTTTVKTSAAKKRKKTKK